MLSVLIPTFNFNITKLVKSILNQFDDSFNNFEIIVADDCSTDKIIKDNNSTITTLPYVKYIPLEKNIGRSAIRNLLGKEAKNETLLFLDADVLPVNDNFLGNYFSFLKTNPSFDIIYGGIIYQKEKPAKDQVLRWKYGNEREAISLNERIKKPYINFLTLNFIIKKSAFDIISFNEEIPNLRCEDTLFSQEAKNKKLLVKHIDNSVVHLGLETSKVFLKKSLESIEVRQGFVKDNILDPNYTKLTSLAYKIEKGFILKKILAIVFSAFQKIMEKNILSEEPSMYLFDFYRLCYYFYNKQNNEKAA